MHIAAAMGRRKLTRVLLEAGEGKLVRNFEKTRKKEKFSQIFFRSYTF